MLGLICLAMAVTSVPRLGKGEATPAPSAPQLYNTATTKEHGALPPPLPPPPIEAAKRTLAWWECGDLNDTALDAGVAWFAARLDAVTTASTVMHSLGPNATLLASSFGPRSTQTISGLYRALRASGVRVLPTVYNDESHNDPPTLLPKLRALFASPGPVVSHLVALAVDSDLDGWNLDFELAPGENVTEADGVALARFIDVLGGALAAHGKTVSVDVGTSQTPFIRTLWNASALNASRLGRALDMGTYGDSRGDPYDFQNFVASFGRIVGEYSCDKVGIGFCPACLNKSRPFTPQQLDARFELIHSVGCIQELDMWVNDCPDGWLPHLRRFLQSG